VGEELTRIARNLEPTKEPQMLLAIPSVALGFGAFFLCAATCTHFDEIGSSPLSLVPDWAAGFAMVGGAFVSSRDWSDGRAYQVAAWAFMVSLLFHSFLGNLEGWLSPGPAEVPTGLVSLSQGPYLASVGILCLVALGGLISSLRSRSQS
jgi:hypothetical protein